MKVSISTWDLVIICVYLVGIVGLGLAAASWQKRRRGGAGRTYFLAGGSLTWPMIGLALFSTNISTIHLVSLAQEGYVNGLAYGNFEWMASFILIVLALFFAPFYIRSGVTTLPDFMEKRYSRTCRDWLAGMSIVSAIFIHIGFSLYAGAVVLRGIFGIDIMWSIVITAALTGLYTIVGGLMAVVVTETVQTIILLLGAICITAIAYVKVGGWAGLAATVDPVQLTMLRSADDPSNLPAYAVFLGIPVIGLWYWCADQTIVQRVLAARDENQARLGPLFAGFIKILPVFVIVLPGLLGQALIRQGRLPDTLQNSSDIYAFLINHLLPVGVKGLVVAALLAALMSTVSGALNSIATLFSYDLYRRWRPASSDRRLVTVGRIVTFFAMLAAIAWSPLLGRYQSIFQGINAIISYIAPPITAVLMFGVFWPRASSTAAKWTLWAGTGLGLVVFILDWFKDVSGWNVPFLMTAFYLFVVCSFLMLLISYLHPHQHTEESRHLVWRNPLEALSFPGGRGLGNYKVVAGVLFVTMIGLYVVFG